MHTRLILDEQSVSHSQGVRFHLNQAAKHPHNPVMLPGMPHQWDSLCVGWPGTVLYSPRDQTYRCWYAGMDVVQTPDRAWHTGYAESDDGIHWHKPELGQFEFLGRSTNRLKPAWNVSFLSLAFENPFPDALPAQRFGGYWTEHRFAGEPGDWSKSRWLKSLAWSPDGIVWTRAAVAYGEMPRAPFLDISQVLHDPSDPDPDFRWKAYGQRFVPRLDGSKPPGVRTVGLAHGSDVARVRDADQPVVLSPQPGIDEEIHFAAVQPVGDSYLMLFESDRFSRNPIHGDLRLAVSRDGRSFRRVHPQHALVATGPRGMWDENLLVTTSAGFQLIGDEIRIYYFGCPNTYNAWPAQYAVTPERRGSLFFPVYLGLATLPRDRFAFAAGEGHLILQGSGAEVWLNAEGDAMKAELMNEAGDVVAAGSITPEPRQGVYRRVRWNHSPTGSRFRLRVFLGSNQCLFSVQHD